MIIKTLVENRSISKEYGCEHGLSLYIETGQHKLLFDTGASDLFYENGKKLGVRFREIDFAVISHGHFDHGGGLKKFLQENHKAGLYMHSQAFGQYYALRQNGEKEYIGLDQELQNEDRIIFTKGSFTITDKLELYSDIQHIAPLPVANSHLMMEQKGRLVRDSFEHEQNLIIMENDKSVLITGCAHNGIVNIVEQFKIAKGYFPDCVIGGFHLAGNLPGGGESAEVIKEIANYLLFTKAKYYTGHCTGIEPYNQLKEIMGKEIDYLPAGGEIII